MDINEKYTVKKYMNIVNAFGTVASHATRRDEILKNKRILKKYKSLSEENLKYSKLAKLSPYLDIPDSVKIQSDYAESIFSKRKYNEVYATYFDKMAIDYNDERYKTIAQNIRACAADWFFSEYSLQSTRILNSIFLCKNKFCSNCQHLRQGVHLKRFGAAFEKLSETNDLHHVTLTVPNVSGLMLNSTINAILKNFLKLIRYFSLDAKISGVDFEKFGYIGAVGVWSVQ